MNTALNIQDMELSTELDQAALKQITGGRGRGRGRGRGLGRFMRRRRVIFRPYKKHWKVRRIRLMRVL